MHWNVLSMPWNLDLEKILHALSYQPRAPLLFNSGFFLWFFTAFLVVYALVFNRSMLRTLWVVAASLYFYYKSSGMYWILMLGTSALVFLLGLWMERTEGARRKKLAMGLGIVWSLAFLIYFKYGAFFLKTWDSLTGTHTALPDLFLPLGISFYTFELIAYLVDIHRGKSPALRNPLDFAFYVSFFPHLVAGPIVRPAELIPQIRKPQPINGAATGLGVWLLGTGLIKKAILSDYLSLNFVDRIFDNPTLYSGLENLMGVYGYTLQIYCDFSGYTDMALGIALLMGYQLPQNFNRPYQATNLTDFWRRWHISLSSWLRDYLYIPLGGNRGGRLRQHLNQLITMLLGGLWHGADWKFVWWGALHGLGLGADKEWRKLNLLPEGKWRNLLGGIVTFHFVAFCWIFFRAGSLSDAWKVIDGIAYRTQWNLAKPLLLAYPMVWMALAFGFLAHLSPQKWATAAERIWCNIPFLFQTAWLLVVVMAVVQVKSAAVQPFIYFQF